MRAQDLPRRQSGFTYLELIVCSMILAILAAAVIPVAQVTAKRVKETELKRNLTIIRNAIDDYSRLASTGMLGSEHMISGGAGYPKDLEILVEGITPIGGPPGKKIRYLRRIPIDPMTGTTDWGLRSYEDDPDSTFWGGENVYDVYSKSDGTALNGTKYRDW